MRRLPLSLALGAAILAAAASAGIAAETAAPAPAYAPGLGDFMTAYVQPHHIKLWYAASAGDWDLAAYEADELGETFDDVSTYAPTWKSVPVAKLVEAIFRPALKKVDAAVAAKNMADFKNAYDTLTAACNSCHVTAHHPFLQIGVPATNPFSDQIFRHR